MPVPIRTKLNRNLDETRTLMRDVLDLMSKAGGEASRLHSQGRQNANESLVLLDEFVGLVRQLGAAGRPDQIGAGGRPAGGSGLAGEGTRLLGPAETRELGDRIGEAVTEAIDRNLGGGGGGTGAWMRLKGGF